MGEHLMFVFALCFVSALIVCGQAGTDHSQGLPCPNGINLKCLPKYRCGSKDNKEKCIPVRKDVSFEANAAKFNGHYRDGTTLIFTNVTLNDGQGYNSGTGVFKAPVSGVYKFTMHICHQAKQHMVYALVKGLGDKGKQIATSTAYESQYSSCNSLSHLAQVAVNEEVKVIARWGHSYLQTDIYRWPSFSGILEYRYK